MPRLEAILWDFGGVLTTSPFEAFNRFEAENGLPNDFIRGINATNPHDNAWARFESSQIEMDEFDRLFRQESKARGFEVAGSQVVELLSGDIRPRMAGVLKVCKEHFRVGCITNNIKSGQGPGMATSTERADRVAQVMSMFDVIVESSMEGVRKPNPEIYRIACSRMSVEPVAAAFLDDLGVNLKPARELGMTTIKVIHEEQAIAELAGVTGLEFP